LRAIDGLDKAYEFVVQEQINNFPAFLETPILYLIHRFTCRARVEELVGDVMAFMRDRYFMVRQTITD
jgi:hypothetical protein